MSPDAGEYDRTGPYWDKRLPIVNEYYVNSEYNPEEEINSGGIEVRTDINGGRYYTVRASIDSDSLALLRTILKHPTEDSFTEQELKYVLPDVIVYPNGMAGYRIAKDTKLTLTPKQGVIIKDKDMQEESLIRRNFYPGINPSLCALPNATHYRYQVDSLIKDRAVFEWDGIKYGAHINAGVQFKSLSPTVIKEDLELLRRHRLLDDLRARQMVNPYFGISLFALSEDQLV
ncbi:MAG: hypothetical protein Q7T54_03210 [Candidatus Levybacteria bacterium]|nr:hypothetical protein [Candidatus Levybacteria bacterium]